MTKDQHERAVEIKREIMTLESESRWVNGLKNESVYPDDLFERQQNERREYLTSRIEELEAEFASL